MTVIQSFSEFINDKVWICDSGKGLKIEIIVTSVYSVHYTGILRSDVFKNIKPETLT